MFSSRSLAYSLMSTSTFIRFFILFPASDMWCSGRPSEDYPASLIVGPTNFATKAPEREPSGSGFVSPYFLTIYLAIFVALLVRMEN